MTKLFKGITGVLFIAAIVNAGHQAYTLHQTFNPAFQIRDSVWQIDKLLGATRSQLLQMNVERIGYRIAPGVPWEQKSTDLYWIQHALAPIVIRQSNDNAGDEWVMVNYSPDPRPFPAPDLMCIEDFGFGLALHKKTGTPPRPDATPSTEPPELGRVWHEREGDWTGTWTRRELSDIFDAVWTGPGGQQVSDEIRYESSDCGTVVLFRKGANGRYRGQLSTDGTRIENGRADWFSPDHVWSATIEKAP